jgi:hypothetical protein
LKTITHEMQKALQPFLSDLISYYKEVAKNGEVSKPDPICKMTEKGHCFECPVFGQGVLDLDHYAAQCQDYFPYCDYVVITDEGITSTSGDRLTAKQQEKGMISSKEHAKKWGHEMVQFLESLRLSG